MDERVNLGYKVRVLKPFTIPKGADMIEGSVAVFWDDEEVKRMVADGKVEIITGMRITLQPHQREFPKIQIKESFSIPPVSVKTSKTEDKKIEIDETVGIVEEKKKPKARAKSSAKGR